MLCFEPMGKAEAEIYVLRQLAHLRDFCSRMAWSECRSIYLANEPDAIMTEPCLVFIFILGLQIIMYERLLRRIIVNRLFLSTNFRLFDYFF